MGIRHTMKIVVSIPLDRLNQETRSFLMADSLARSMELANFTLVSLFKLRNGSYRLINVPATIEKSTTNFNWQLRDRSNHVSASLLSERVIARNNEERLLEGLKERLKVQLDHDGCFITDKDTSTIISCFEDTCKRL
jgi:hypothetical protein